MIKNIKNLTKIFIKDSFKINNIIGNSKKLNKKTSIFWMIIILIICISYFSYKLIDLFLKVNMVNIFLNIYFPILMLILLFQAILSCVNIFYFSKDIEFILPLPIKPIELLISKINTLIFNLYITELIFGIIPLLLFGIMTSANILYYFLAIIVLILFPILPSIFVSICTIILMRLSKFFKNKNSLQQMVTSVLLIIVLFLFYISFKSIIQPTILNEKLNQEYLTEISNNEEQAKEIVLEFITNIKNVGKSLLIINPSIDLLLEKNILIKLFSFFKIILLNLLFIIIFMSFGKITYLKDILNNYISNLENKIKKINWNKKCKKKTIKYSYIKKEILNIIKNPYFILQGVYPIITLMIVMMIIVIVFNPNIQAFMESELLETSINDFNITLNIIIIFLVVIQIVFTLNSLSITAISREGKNIDIIKYLPISIYKQIIYKGMPQIFINLFVIFAVIFMIKFLIPTFDIIYLIFILINGIILSIINSYLMIIIDLKKPNLNWNSEFEVMKQNKNKIYQYVLTILIILLLVYFLKIFDTINIILANILIIFILMIISIIILFILKNKSEKYLNNIN